MGFLTIHIPIHAMTMRLSDLMCCNGSLVSITKGISRFPSLPEQNKFTILVQGQVISIIERSLPDNYRPLGNGSGRSISPNSCCWIGFSTHSTHLCSPELRVSGGRFNAGPWRSSYRLCRFNTLKVNNRMSLQWFNIVSFMLVWNLENGNHILIKCFEFSNLDLGGLSLLRQRDPPCLKMGLNQNIA